jgi:hypothetical protein
MDMTKITGLWKAKDKNGNTYLCGALNNITQLAVMPNMYKRNEKDPDYFIYVKPTKKNGEGGSAKNNFGDDL